MCGITGIASLDKKPVSKSVLNKMTQAIIHRGPDGKGVFLDGYIGLGHCRLAILDLTKAANQPMTTDDGRFTITYNGEIYNFLDLRKELSNLGYTFQSNSDSEVVLKSFAEWGKNSVERFNGMFAFAIWDKKKKELFLARDRYGIKPLYYFHNQNVFLFSSEIKSFLSHPLFRPEIDKEALVEYLTFQNFFTKKTLYKNVQMLPQGTHLTISFKNNFKIKEQLYWDFQFVEPKIIKRKSEYLDELRFLITQAVQRQLVSDVPVGSYLSGGMDSGTICAIAALHFPYLKTFTVGFDLRTASGIEMSFDERQNAEFMSYKFRTEHYEMVLKSGDMERIMTSLLWHLDEPRVGQCYPNFYAAQLASKFVKVVLSGAGGDELFGGYPWRYYRAVNNTNFDDYINKYYRFWQRLIPDNQMKSVLAPIWNDVKHVNTREIFKSVFKNHQVSLKTEQDYINHSLYFESKTFLHGLLVVEDKMSMAHSLETRVPFLDNDLVDFALQLPISLKLDKLNKLTKQNENETGNKVENYFMKTRNGKLLLRKAMEKFIPKEVTDQTKQGFSAPDSSWFKGESINYVKNLILHDKAKIYEIMDIKTVFNLIQDHLKGHHNRRLLIWSLLNLELWMKKHS